MRRSLAPSPDLRFALSLLSAFAVHGCDAVEVALGEQPADSALPGVTWGAAVAASAYAPRVVGDRIVAINPAQRARATFASDGLVIVDRDGEIGLRLTAWGRAGGEVPAEDTSPRVDARCAAGDALGDCLPGVQYRRSGVTEWWENRPDGFEQGFTVPVPPAGEGELVFDLAITGATVTVDGDEATLARPSGGRLRYAGLAAWDATGQDLPAWMEPTAAGVRLVVDDSRAIGAVTVDPLLSATAVWTAESNQASAYFGNSVASAGDVNGDGYDDVVIGAYFYDGAVLDEGQARLYLGSAAGLSAVADWSVVADQPDESFGISVASAGDVNGDGYDDLVVGAYGFDGGESEEGRAYVYLGSAAGLSIAPAWTAESGQAAAFFGIAVASAGDVNGDGYDDVLVGAYTFDDGETDEGRAFLYLGSAAGLSATADWTAESDQANAYFGFSVASAGDVDGDGYDDVLVGAFSYDNGETDEGRAFLYRGSAAGLSAAPAWTAESNQAGATFGHSVATAGDVNADGYHDVAVGAPLYDGGQADEGRAYVYLGSVAGLSAGAAWTAESDQAGASFGYSVARAGDANADGYDDLVVGAREFDNGATDEGRAYVYIGSPAGLGTFPGWTVESNQANGYLGHSAAGAGDVNADGYDDVVVGAPLAANGQYNEGLAHLYLGGSDVDLDGDGSDDSLDCDDLDSGAYPGAAEVVADGVDQDCDGVDSCYADADGDDLGSATVVAGSSLDCTTGNGAPVAGDNCPADANPDQSDADADALGDACDACAFDADNDADADGVCGDTDLCPLVADPGQANTDGDAAGDACDPCVRDLSDDSDGDGSCDSDDACPGFDDRSDGDGDGAPDACDPCPTDPADACDVADTDAPADTDADVGSDKDGSGGFGCDATPAAQGAWLGLIGGLVAVSRRRGARDITDRDRAARAAR